MAFSALVFLYLVVFPFGQLGRFELGGGINFHLVDLLVGFIAFLWLLRRKFKFPGIARPFLAFTAVSLFSLVFAATRFNAFELFVGSLYWLRWVAYMLFFFALWKNKLFDSLIVVGAAVAVFGWLQYLLEPDTRVLLDLGWDEHYFRLIGTFLDPGFTGILLVFFTLLIFSRTWKRGEQARGWVLFLLGFSALALTYSRASYLAFLAGLAAFYIVRRNLKLLVGEVALLLITLLLLPRPGGEGTLLTRTSTVEARFESYTNAVSIASNNPVFGTGFNLYRFQQENQISHAASGSDSSLLFVLATTGVVGLSVYSWLWWRILELGWRNRQSSQGVALFSSAAALLVHSFFNNSLFYPWVMGWMAILLGMQRIKESK